jgi:hypothetical protein
MVFQLGADVHNLQRNIQLRGGLLSGLNAVARTDVQIDAEDLKALFGQPPCGNGGVHTAGKTQYDPAFLQTVTALLKNLYLLE